MQHSDRSCVSRGAAVVARAMTARRRAVMVLALSITVFASGVTFGADIGASLKIGSSGFGADVTVGVAENVNIRGGFNAFSLTLKPDSDEDDDENITLRLKLQTFPLVADWHPWANNFRVSGGVALNNNELSLKARPGDQIEFNDEEYRVERFTLAVTFNQFSPYLGIGYGNAATGGKRFVFACDFGLMFHGTPKVRARAVASDPALQERLNRDLDAEIDDLRDDLKSFSIYPVLNVGVAYRF